MFNEDHEIYGQYRPVTIKISASVEIYRATGNSPYEVYRIINGEEVLYRSVGTEKAARQIAAKLLG